MSGTLSPAQFQAARYSAMQNHLYQQPKTASNHFESYDDFLPEKPIGGRGRLIAHQYYAEKRTEKIQNHLNHIENVGNILRTSRLVHTGKETSRGLRTLYRSRSFAVVGLSTVAWIGSAVSSFFCPPAAIPLTAIAAGLTPIAIADEWRTSEQVIHRQKKAELIRRNTGLYQISNDPNLAEISAIKKTFFRRKHARRSFLLHINSLFNKHPELHPNFMAINSRNGNPFATNGSRNYQGAHSPPVYEIPFYRGRHRISVFTPNLKQAQLLAAEALKQSMHLR
jgi:hypothetical protein